MTDVPTRAPSPGPSPASPPADGPPRRLVAGPLVVLTVIALIQATEQWVLPFPNPEALCLLAVAYATFTGGLYVGLASGAVVIAWAIGFYDTAGVRVEVPAARIGILAMAAAGMAALVGALQRHATVQLQRARESEEHTRAVIDAVADAMLIFGEDGRLVEINQGAARLFGVEHAAAAGAPVSDLLPDIQSLIARRGQVAGTYELAGRDRGGRAFPTEVVVSEARRKGQRLRLAVVRDVSERKLAEQALERQAARLGEQAELLELAHDTIMVRDMGSIIRYWNHGAEKMYGFSRDEAVGRSSHELLQTEFPAPLGAIEEELVREGRWEGELIHRRRDGTRVVAASRWALQRDASGRPKGILEINNDVTERKRAELALERLSRQHELILESAGEGIYGLDLRGVATFVNPAGARLLGYDAGELVGRDLDALLHDHDGEGRADCALAATLADGVARSVGDDRYRHKDGRRVPVEYECTPIREGDRLVGVVVTFRDVTERREMERLKDEFVSVVSHELRTPLTSIRGALGLLASGALAMDSAKGRRMLHAAAASTDRLSRLVNDILDLERMQSGALPMGRVPCDAADLLLQAAEVIRPLADGAGVLLDVRAQSLMLSADPDRMIQTLTNLLSNAVKFSPRGSVVQVWATAEDGQVVFHVSDQGRGIPPEKREHIFERFAQVDASDARVGGTGLGLAICRRIVEQHDGRIWLDSAIDRGTTFHVAIAALPRDSAPAAPTREGAALPALDRLVLVIDDDEVIREVAQASLETVGGCRVLTAGSAGEGLALARRERPDAILLDLMMPDVDGIAVCRELRADPALRTTPVIFLTAKSQSLEAVRIDELGATSVIAKPFDPLKLPLEVARVLGWVAVA